MSFKEIIKSWRLGDYFRQLSIIIIGVLVTFQGSKMISNASHKKEMNHVLYMVSDELSSKVEQMTGLKKLFQHEKMGAELFKKYAYDIKSMPKDSLEEYFDVIGNTLIIMESSHSLEVFKTSYSTLPRSNKELMVKIYEAYAYSDAVYKGANEFFAEKKKVIFDFYYSLNHELVEQLHNDNNLHLYAEEYLKNPVTYNFFLNSLELYDRFIQNIDEMTELVNKTIDQIDKEAGKKKDNSQTDEATETADASDVVVETQNTDTKE